MCLRHVHTPVGDPSQRNPNASVSKETIALVIALAKLHNFCIDENDAQAPPSHALNELRTEMRGGAPLETTTTSTGSRVLTPPQLLDGGRHFDDIDLQSRRRRVRQY
jgi:hypothetical protein